MTVRSRHLTLVGAAGAVALTVGALASPALATGPVSASSVAYDCLALSAVHVTPTADYNVAAPPTSLVAGQLQKLSTTSTFTLNSSDTGLASVALNAAAFSGTINTSPSNRGVGLSLTFPKTNLGNNGDGTTTANAAGNTLLRFTKAGTFTLKLGDIGKVKLQGYDSSGNPTKSATFPDSSQGNGPCQNQAGSTPLQDATPANATVSVSKDKSKTTVAAKYVAKKKKTKASAKVKGATYGLAGTGKVKFIFKKGTHTLKKLSGKLNKKGIASVVFKKALKKGKYSVTAKFGGDGGLKASSKRVTYRVR